MARLEGEDVAGAIREHQLHDSDQWRYRRLVTELHVWLDRFDCDYDLRIPTAVIAIAAQRIDVLASYRLGRSAIGARTTITFNERAIEQRPFSQTLETLMHEAVHAWEEWHVGRDRATWYHTAAWRERMRDIGIITDTRGHHLEVSPHFHRYLNRYGVPNLHDLLPGSSPLADQMIDGSRPRRQLPKWICACASGNPARATYLQAVCQRCGKPYRPA